MRRGNNTQVANSVPFDNSNTEFNSVTTQEAIEEAKISGVPFNEIDCGVYLSHRTYKAYSATSGQVINGTPSTLILNDYSMNSDTQAFNLSSGELTFFIEGRYSVNFNVTFDNSNSSITTTKSIMQIDKGLGFIDIEGSEIYTYERQVGNLQTGSGTVLINVIKGDKIRIVSYVISGSNNLTSSDGCSILVTPRIEATSDHSLGINCKDITETIISHNHDAGEL